MKTEKRPSGPNLLEVDITYDESLRIFTLEALLKKAKVDLKVWEVEKYLVNSWEVGAKNSDGDIVVEPLFQVKAWLKRKKLKASRPVIQPLSLNFNMRTFQAPRKGKVQTALVLPDPQFGFSRNVHTGELEPFHDMRALDVAVQIAYDLRPHTTIFLGDTLDLPDWSSKFPQMPEFHMTTQPAVVAAAWWLKRIRDACPRSRAVMLEGNHDRRLEMAIVDHLRAAYELRAADELHLPPSLSVPRLLALHRLGIQYLGAYPNGEFWLTDQFLMTHGDVARNGSGKTTASLVKEYDVSIMTGHIHRIERATRTRTDRKTIGAYSPGCLCRTDGIVPGRKERQNWQQGLAVVHYDERDVHVQLVEIKDGRALFGAKVYIGADRTLEMAQDTGWQF